MATVDGLVALVAGVKAFLAGQKVTAAVDFGWNAREKWINQGPGGGNRIVFVPGQVDPSEGPPKVSDAGPMAQPRLKAPGNNPRPLVQWARTVTMFVWGADTTDLEDELKQYAATVGLFEYAVQALHNAVYIDSTGHARNVGLADVVFEKVMWSAMPSNQAFGRELVAYFHLDGPLFDMTIQLATPQPAILRDPAS